MNLVAIIWSGFVATTFATAFFWVFRSLGWTLFSPTVSLGGIFMAEPGSPATETLGFGILFLLGSTLVPVLYALALNEWLEVDWLNGTALGLSHGFIAAAALPALGMISASIRRGPLPEPGRFGWRWGRMTPLAVTLGHGLYGGVLGAILAGF